MWYTYVDESEFAEFDKKASDSDSIDLKEKVEFDNEAYKGDYDNVTKM